MGLELDVVVKRDILGFVDVYSKTFYLIFSAYYLASIFSVTLPLLSFVEMQLMIYCVWCWYNWAQCKTGVEFLCYSKYHIVLCIQTVHVVRHVSTLKHSVTAYCSVDVWYSFVIFQHCSRSTTHTVHASNTC